MTPVTGRDAMVAAMAPVSQPGGFVFCAGDDPAVRDRAIAAFREPEGWSAILSLDDAAALGVDGALPMRQITLQVHSALDGVGLTAAVATALAEAGIACNMVAALRHDHVFVPAADAERALAVLRRLQAQVASTVPAA